MKDYQATIPVASGGTDRYNDGWNYADWFLSKGGSPDADAPGDWHDEKCSGFWDRLAIAKKAQEKAASAK